MIFPALAGLAAGIYGRSLLRDAANATVNKVGDVLDSVHSPSDASDFNELIHNQTGGWLKDFENLFETTETAAVNQAQRNEAAAIEAWKRSEQSAERAAARTRELRKTAYQDAVASLRAAGLNPVLAASGGISGGSVTAPMAQAPAASSNMADGLKAADLLSVLSNYVGSVKSLVSGIIPFVK